MVYLEATDDDVCFAVEHRLVGYRRDPFPRPFTIYARNLEDVSLGVGDFAQALTNSGDGTRDAENGRGDGAEP